MIPQELPASEEAPVLPTLLSSRWGKTHGPRSHMSNKARASADWGFGVLSVSLSQPRAQLLHTQKRKSLPLSPRLVLVPCERTGTAQQP